MEQAWANDYRRLNERYCKYESSLTWSKRIENSLFLATFGLLFVFMYFLYIPNFNDLFSALLVAGFLLFCLIGRSLFPRIIIKRARKFQLNPDEQAILHAFAAYDNIDNYFSESARRNMELRLDYKKQAILHTKLLLAVIRKNWVVGEFNLGQSMLGKRVNQLINNMSSVLLPTIQQSTLDNTESDKSLVTAGDMLYQLIAFLHYPTTDALDHINEMIPTQLRLTTVRIPERKRNQNIAGFFADHTILLHSLSIGAIVGLSVVVYYIGLFSFHMTPENSYSTTVQFLGTLFIGYLVFALTLIVPRIKKSNN